MATDLVIDFVLNVLGIGAAVVIAACFVLLAMKRN